MNNQFIKLIKNLLAFIGVGSLVYAILIWVWGTYVPPKYTQNLNYKLGSSSIRFEEVKRFENIDILFAGSSHSFRGFDPRIFDDAGYSSFNIGSSAQTPLQTKYLLEEYLDGLKPKILMLEVYPKIMTTDGVESTLDIISNNKDVNGLKLVLWHKNLRVLNTFVYSKLPSFFRRSAIRLSPIDTYIGRGYVEKEIYFNKPKELIVEKLIYLDYQLNFLAEIDKICKKNGVFPIYIFAPIDKNLYNSFINLGEFDRQIKDMGVYYDFNRIISLNDTLHFYDSHHLNQRGVELFNGALIEKLTFLKDSLDF